MPSQRSLPTVATSVGMPTRSTAQSTVWPVPKNMRWPRLSYARAWCGQVDREVRYRRVRRRDSTRDDAVDVQVRGEVPVGLLEQREREVELGLGDALAEVEVDAIGHVLASERTGPSR
jgi:hypothetical protein